MDTLETLLCWLGSLDELETLVCGLGLHVPCRMLVIGNTSAKLRQRKVEENRVVCMAQHCNNLMGVACSSGCANVNARSGRKRFGLVITLRRIRALVLSESTVSQATQIGRILPRRDIHSILAWGSTWRLAARK